MKTSILILLSLFVSSVCFGLSGRVVLSYSKKYQAIEGFVFTNDSSDSFLLKTSDLSFAKFVENKDSLNDIKSALSNAFGDSFDKEHFNTALTKNLTGVGDVENLKINYGGVKNLFELFLILANCQITEIVESETLGVFETRIYFYKPD